MSREERLDEYRAKRDFDATPEPAGERAPAPESASRFVIQEHHARRLHWDLRLEHDGALASWALPNGVPDVPGENRLAVRTEDHPIEYLDFEGDIPEGTYGAGHMAIWDRGDYTCEKWEPAKVDVELRGERVQGRYALFRMRDKDWMIHRVDPPTDPEREPMPERLVPMLARPGRPPDDDPAFGLEIRWEGIRALAFCEPGRLRLQGAALEDLTPRYPELRGITRALGHHWALLDGELVALDGDGRPSRERLEQRARLTDERAIRRRAESVPVVYVVYDLLHLDGRSLMEAPYEERRERLRELELEGAHCQVPAHHVGEGAALLRASRRMGLPGIVAKPLDSAYEPGRRGWLEIGEAAEPAPPPAKAKKGDPGAYYAHVAPILLPHLHGRPGWEDANEDTLVERGAKDVELHTSLALAGDLGRPTALLLDLDPGTSAGIAECCQVAVWLRGMLGEVGLRSFAKTSGAGGLQVLVPLNTKIGYDQTRRFARAVAETLERARPERVVARDTKGRPPGTVLVDWTRNDRQATTVCAYSLCAGKRPGVSMPVSWEEVEGDPDLLAFDPRRALERVDEEGDLLAPALSLVQDLPAAR